MRYRVFSTSCSALRPSPGRGAFVVEAPVAQGIEYCPPKAGVAGSIPAGRAKSDKPFSDFLLPKFLPGVAKVQLTWVRPAPG